MKKNYTSIILLIAMLFGAMSIAQEAQKNHINYQGVARNDKGLLMAGESMTVGIALKFGSTTSTTLYEENHTLATDANGVFSLLIGNGSSTVGNYNSLPWGSAATFVTVSMNGNEVGTTEMMAVPYAISSGDADDQSATEVPYDNTTSGLTATNTQGAIDELVGSGAVDADADPTNELQNLSFDAATNELSLSDGNMVTIPSGGTDADADPTNELQDISLSGTELTISDGSTIDFAPIVPPGGTDDQNLVLTGDVLTIENGTGSVDLSAYGDDADADPTNEIDKTAHNGILLGDGAAVSGLVGTSDGQVAKWDNAASTWVAGTDATGGAGGSSLWAEDGNGINYGSGNVGIGGGSLANYPLRIHSAGASTTLYTLEGYGSEAIDGLSVGIVEGIGAAIGSIMLRENGPLYFGTNYQTRMAIREDGAVGIGTQTPDANLEVSGEGTVRHRMTSTDAGTVSLQWLREGAANTDWMFTAGSSGMEISHSSSDLTGGIVHMRLSDDGILDVRGGIRAADLEGSGQRNVMADADGNLVIGAGGGGSSLWAEDGNGINYGSGNVGIGGGSSANYPLQILTDSERPINLSSSNDDNYIAFNNSTNYVGYAGVFNGDRDMDFGTGFLNGTGSVHLVTNAFPKLTVAADGDVGIGTTTPTAKLDVDGDIKTSGEVHGGATGDANMIPIAYGYVDASGNILSGSGNFTVSKLGALLGLYSVTIPDEDDPANWIVLTTINHTAPAVAVVSHSGSIARNFSVNTWRLNSTRFDSSFSFVVYKR